MEAYVLVLLVGLAAGVVSGIIGTGSSIMLLPVLVLAFGPKQAVPIMAVAAVMANVARVVAWRREINWRAFAAYSLTGVPAAALGARTLLELPVTMINAGLGLFFLLMIPVRYAFKSRLYRIRLWQLAICGAVIGFLTGLVLSTGPLSVPAFTAYGLVKGAFLSTEAASSLAIYLSKIATFRELGALPVGMVIQGIIVGASLTLGTFVAKAMVQRMKVATFQYVLDLLLFVSGVSMLWAAWVQSP
ncbi:sulfite exporter TauE/SafE family protein [Paenibacillus filicis]|uniref:Probable membrane transporter protein n=1 Tax=Paenibacillus gyeongsangnamensis TaxID=3388067 RepID=A0ABT4QLI5_9BACL|nr:sulfite exporter TauE/SafE family protein [Paenibacillus filicis]MCZ8517738.1 sulfite exporter TauE/SafE family protein [Paenibacillus filicis]